MIFDSLTLLLIWLKLIFFRQTPLILYPSPENSTTSIAIKFTCNVVEFVRKADASGIEYRF